MANPFQKIRDNQQFYFENVLRKSSLFERKQKLKKVKKWIKENESHVVKVLYDDFKKSPEEVRIAEIKPVISEINDALKNLRDWAAPQRVKTPLYLLGSKSHIISQPKGLNLIIAPWNFPFNLTIGPLISAIAAGNCAVLKPSELTPNCEQLIVRMIIELFPPEEITVITGGVEETTQLLDLAWDHIFFTGSPQVGKIVMKAASNHLTPVTLELGGKNPVIVDKTANLKDTAQKLIWGKLLNNGQSCVSPNYVLVHASVKAKLIVELKKALTKMYGKTKEEIENNNALTRVVNKRNYERITSLINKSIEQGANVIIGNNTNSDDNYISPTILDNITTSSTIFKDEIFGPVLPLIEFQLLDEAISIINKEEAPLALYIFSSSKKNTKNIIRNTSAGTTGINETTIQFIHGNLPFGGNGHSGIGRSHGKYGFTAFSNERAILKQKRGFTTIKLIYHPTNKFKRFVIRFMTWRM
ncbi:MAG: aldehyde dehydrogenase family protein [Flavobacteriales bacterium]|nr:aldehyde dehydrogenase family protein [Flavobacteriales bacterium]